MENKSDRSVRRIKMWNKKDGKSAFEKYYTVGKNGVIRADVDKLDSDRNLRNYVGGLKFRVKAKKTA